MTHYICRVCGFVCQIPMEYCPDPNERHEGRHIRLEAVQDTTDGSQFTLFKFMK